MTKKRSNKQILAAIYSRQDAERDAVKPFTTQWPPACPTAPGYFYNDALAGGKKHVIKNGVCILCDAGDPTSVISLKESCSA